ncbi:diguanylate cyclase [Eubacteriaceae bacterium ES3]|nr:diguanylate cyclase [Eubacteriaceae bacterium ES3]
MKELIKNNFKLLIKFMAVIFIALSLFTIVITAYFQYKMDEQEKSHLINQEKVVLESEQSAIYNKLNKRTAELLFLSDCLRLHDSGDGDYSDVEAEWLAFSNRKQIYDQIRFIDANGDEIIRVDNNGEGAVLISGDQLQNKSDRYYFINTISLKNNEIYISQFDLNVENGVVEEPQKPMLRFSIPYYDVNGILRGIVLLNYSGTDLLNQVENVSELSGGEVSLLNSQGYWLFNSASADKNWAFMYEGRENESFAELSPEVWQTISSNDEGAINAEEGVYIYSKVLGGQAFSLDNSEYSLVLGDSDWILLSEIGGDSESFLYDSNFGAFILNCIKKYSLIYVGLLIFSFIIALLMVVNKNEKERIKFFSEYDTMTGVLNRRAGFEKLNGLLDKKPHEAKVNSLCFIDINGLKEVNDKLGHDAGDELIKSVVEVIKKNIRGSDLVSRLGGDEFLVIFEGIDVDEAEEVWGRIVAEYNHINESENRRYLISVSHGIEQIWQYSQKYIDEVVNRADEKMYAEKKEIKKVVKILRD